MKKLFGLLCCLPLVVMGAVYQNSFVTDPVGNPLGTGTPELANFATKTGSTNAAIGVIGIFNIITNGWNGPPLLINSTTHFYSKLYSENNFYSGTNWLDNVTATNVTVPAVGALTNLSIGATKVVITDANGKEVGATLNNMTLVGTTLTALGGAGSQTPWTSDINASGFQLTNLGGMNITGTLSTATLVVTNPDSSIWIQSDTGRGTNTTIVNTLSITGNIPVIRLITATTTNNISGANDSIGFANAAGASYARFNTNVLYFFNNNTNALRITNGAAEFYGTLNMGTNDGDHMINILAHTNSVIAIDSDGTDSTSMLHIANTGSQGPFFDFHGSASRWGYGVASGGAFNIRKSATGTDPVNGSTVVAITTDGLLSATNITTSGYWRSPTNGWTDGQVLTGSGANGDTKWATPSASGGGGTNSGPIALGYDGTIVTNVAVLATTPVGCVTNAPLPYRLTLTTNALFQNPTGTIQDGQVIRFELIQDATGNRVGYWDTKFSFGTDITAITLTTNASKRDFVTFIYSTTPDKWFCTGFLRGY